MLCLDDLKKGQLEILWVNRLWHKYFGELMISGVNWANLGERRRAELHATRWPKQSFCESRLMGTSTWFFCSSNLGNNKWKKLRINLNTTLFRIVAIFFQLMCRVKEYTCINDRGIHFSGNYFGCSTFCTDALILQSCSLFHLRTSRGRQLTVFCRFTRRNFYLYIKRFNCSMLVYLNLLEIYMKFLVCCFVLLF